MPRRRRSPGSRRRWGSDPAAVLAVLALGAVLSLPRIVLLLALVAITALVAVLLLRHAQRCRRLEGLRQLDLSGIDAMDPIGFEGFVAELLAAQGYCTQLTQASRDLGVDVVASRGSRRIAVQVKLYSSPVSAKAIGEVLVGMPHYGCTECMVVTNSTFTAPALKAAELHPCTLIDRQGLAVWLQQTQSTPVKGRHSQHSGF